MLKSFKFSIWSSFLFFLNLKGVNILADRANAGVISVIAQSSFYPNLWLPGVEFFPNLNRFAEDSVH